MFENLKRRAERVERLVAVDDLPDTLEAVGDYCREGGAILRRLRDRTTGPMARASVGSEERDLVACRETVARIRATVGTPVGATAPRSTAAGSSGESGFGPGDRAVLAEVVGTVLDLIERFRNK
jgi:hypothetical protein